MYSKFPFSMENIPRQKSFVCLSLKFGCIFAGLFMILYSVLTIAQCLAALNELAPHANSEETGVLFSYVCVVVLALIYVITLFLSAVMLVGALREKARLIKPWVVWMSFILLGYLLLFVFWTTMNMIHNIMDQNAVLMYFIEVLRLLIRVYLLTLVASYYKQLDGEEGERLKTLLNNDHWISP